MIVRAPNNNVVGFSHITWDLEDEKMSKKMSQSIVEELVSAEAELSECDGDAQFFDTFSISDSGDVLVHNNDSDDGDNDFLYIGEAGKELAKKLKGEIERRIQNL